jgi:general secretion pathway protein F
LLRALQTTADTLGNAALREQALALADWVREGTPLASGLEHQAHWPRVLGLFTRMGEQTGDLSGMLAQASAHMSEDVERRALTLTTWLEPVLVVVMGLVVLLIVLAVMLPIVEMNALVR